METIKLTIDNKQVEVAKGTNLVEAAASAGIRIPTLCYMNLHDLGYENKPGACRICVVEVEGDVYKRQRTSSSSDIQLIVR